MKVFALARSPLLCMARSSLPFDCDFTTGIPETGCWPAQLEIESKVSEERSEAVGP